MTNRTAFVSGSGRNIGRAIVLEFARAGCNVIVNGSANEEACNRVAEEASGHGVEAAVVMGDVGDSGAVGKMAAQALAQFGAVDIVVNNASIRPSKPFLEMDDEYWHHVISVDMHAAFYTGRAFVPGMVERGWGRVINITGMNAIHGYAGRAPVSVAKHGLWGLTKSMAKEFGPNGITVNAISPGPIRGERDDPEMSKHIEETAAKIPLKRMGEPEHIAGLCGYLISEAAEFTTGQMIACNGGGQT
ncbi:MAG: SDR family oxidoreductase [Alphaproteobacteria bacterium]|jgi:3-oxoacyl-[acyl-carrier protein] reductase|nr:SDR family oxidoreductase [Alphaproteobacteria bacterium]